MSAAQDAEQKQAAAIGWIEGDSAVKRDLPGQQQTVKSYAANSTPCNSCNRKLRDAHFYADGGGSLAERGGYTATAANWLRPRPTVYCSSSKGVQLARH